MSYHPELEPLVVEVHNINDLQKILRTIRRIDGVEKIERFQLG